MLTFQFYRWHHAQKIKKTYPTRRKIKLNLISWMTPLLYCIGTLLDASIRVTKLSCWGQRLFYSISRGSCFSLLFNSYQLVDLCNITGCIYFNSCEISAKQNSNEFCCPVGYRGGTFLWQRNPKILPIFRVLSRAIIMNCTGFGKLFTLNCGMGIII